jgi:lysyl-tRNA synthetase class 1
VRARVEAEKGSPLSGREAEILDERVRSARSWLELYAPERARIVVQRDGLPEAAMALDTAQRRYLAALADRAAADRPSGGDAWQALIFTTATDQAVDQKAAFAAIYLAFLGRPNGPRAGWLLASLDPAFVVGRLREAGTPLVTA